MKRIVAPMVGGIHLERQGCKDETSNKATCNGDSLAVFRRR